MAEEFSQNLNRFSTKVSEFRVIFCANCTESLTYRQQYYSVDYQEECLVIILAKIKFHKVFIANTFQYFTMK